jgi:ubiquitin C-terminal hydrolase
MTSRHGLGNLGNTCYLNSAFQALRHTQPFQEYFGTEAWQQHRHADRKGHALAEATAELVQKLKAEGTQIVAPGRFLKEFIHFAREINDDIRYGAQADAAEAIQILLDGLHTQQAREVRMDITGRAITPEHAELVKSLESWATFFRKEYSPLVENYYGQTQIRIICETCGTRSTRYEPWGVLKLPIPNSEKAGAAAPTLHECFGAAFATDTIDEYACETCKKKVKAKMEHSISRFPRHMIVSLKRFTNTGAKVRARIPYDENRIDLAALRTWMGLQTVDHAIYRVVSTVEHLGSSRGGHYIMRAREGKSWFVYDDGSVSPSPIGGAAGPDTYMLFLELAPSAPAPAPAPASAPVSVPERAPPA